MLKLLTFECARIKKSTIREESYDRNACFDRIHFSQSKIFAAKKLDKNLLIARSMCVDRMERHVRTGACVSPVSFMNKEGQPQLCRKLQWKADVPALCCQQSYVLLRAHREIALGMMMNSCTGKWRMQHNNCSYLGDNHSHIFTPFDCQDPVEYVKPGLW